MPRTLRDSIGLLAHNKLRAITNDKLISPIAFTAHSAFCCSIS